MMDPDRKIPFVVKTMRGQTLHVDLSQGQAQGYTGHGDDVVHAIEDTGTGELRAVDLRLGDIFEAVYDR